jgi:uncharacterized repeat protein (TIGR01451 family)
MFNKIASIKFSLVVFITLASGTVNRDNTSPTESLNTLNELPIEERLVGSEANGSLSSSTVLGGAAYINQCSAAGVPIPPDWGTNQWVSRGTLTDAQEFISTSLEAEVFTYKSEAPEGACIALPRAAGNSIRLLGIICLGKTSSNACFWDNQQDANGDGIFESQFFPQKGEVVPLSRFAGGADLATANAGGVCTDCHAGENPFVRHPGTALGPPALNDLTLFADNWYKPLVASSWPQNPGPTTILDSIASEGKCTSCHTLGTGSGTTRGGRFPEVSTALPSYCSTILANAIQRTMPPGSPNNPSYKPHADALLAACGQPPVRPDVGITKAESADPITPGEQLIYTLTVTNHGPGDATGVIVNDILPTGVTLVSANSSQGSCSGVVTCELGTVANGASVTITVVVTVDQTTPQGTITNTASVTNNKGDPDTTNNSAIAETTIIVPADLAVTKSAIIDPVTAGTDQTYQITITNNGPSDAQSITLTDTTPANTTFVSFAGDSAWSCLTPAVGDVGTVTCTISTLGNGAFATFTMVVHANPATPDGSTISNTASVSATTTDSNPGNNVSTVTTGVVTEADLRITLSPTSTVVIAGTDETYNLTVSNGGPSDAQNVTLTGAIPSNTTFVSFVQDLGPVFTCTTPPIGGTGNIDCTIATLAMDELINFILVVRVDPIDVSSISNTASVSSSTTDPMPGNNTDTVKVTVSIKNYKQAILDDLITLRGTVTNNQDGRKLDHAIQRLSNSLDKGFWLTDNTLVVKSGKRVFSQERDAVAKLNELLKHNNSGINSVLLQEFIDRLVAADRALADIAIHQAISASGNANQIARAQNEFSRGDDSANNGQYTMAITRYQNAWQRAQQAMKK